MAGDIKTRTARKDVKAMDKTVTGMERIKNAYVRTKEGTEQTQPRTGAQETPEQYAQEHITDTGKSLSHAAIRQAEKQGGRAVDTVRERRMAARETREVRQTAQTQSRAPKGRGSVTSQPSFMSGGGQSPYQPRQQMIKTAQRQSARQKAAQTAARQTAGQAQTAAKQTIKTTNRAGGTIKTTYQTANTVKQAGKGTVKHTARTIKTSGRTARMTVKTTNRAAQKAHQTAKASAKASKRAAQAVRQTAKETVRIAKATARATKAAVKAVIAATKALMTAIAAGGWIVVMILLIVILLGAAISMVGGDNSSTVSEVSAEVQAYEPLIRQYAVQYEIGEYVELIKAVMMQESGGQGTDPMQSSEGSYNTRYPRQPGGITDAEYSIACGVQELKACLEGAGTESPVDLPHIKLALQGYNYGNGYIEWAVSNYGGYTLANAAEFSDNMARQQNRDSYGDKQYVPHVLRYYPLGRIPTGTGNDTIVQVALTQEGNGGATYWRWYGFENRVSWCACFVSWCAEQCGYLESGVLPKFSLCSDGVAWFESRGQFKDASYIPTAGDLIFFDWEGDGNVDHVGIVESVADGMVYTVEGNSGDKVCRNSYTIGAGSIYGYGIPIF